MRPLPNPALEIHDSTGATGVGLIEIYDISSTAGAVLSNLSTRGLVGTADVLGSGDSG